MQVKTTRRFHCPLKWLKSNSPDNPTVLVVGVQQGTVPLGNGLAISYKVEHSTSQKSHFWRFTKRNKDLRSQENLGSGIYRFIYKSPQPGSSPRALHRGLQVHAHRGEKEEAVYICSTEESHLHILSERSQSLEAHTLCSYCWDILEKAKL